MLPSPTMTGQGRLPSPPPLPSRRLVVTDQGARLVLPSQKSSTPAVRSPIKPAKSTKRYPDRSRSGDRSRSPAGAAKSKSYHDRSRTSTKSSTPAVTAARGGNRSWSPFKSAIYTKSNTDRSRSQKSSTPAVTAARGIVNRSWNVRFQQPLNSYHRYNPTPYNRYPPGSVMSTARPPTLARQVAEMRTQLQDVTQQLGILCTRLPEHRAGEPDYGY